MTRLALLADVHGNLSALEAVLADLAPLGVDQTVLAGDVANAGPCSNEIFALIERSRWPVIRGNGEYYLTDFGTPRGDPSWLGRPGGPTTLAAWFYQHTDPRWRRSVATWPDTLCLRYADAPPLRVCHGTPHSPYEAIRAIATDEEVAAILAGTDESTVVFAHTHCPTDRRVGRWHLINPGSVGNPDDGDRRAQYAIVDGDAEGWRVDLRRVVYDVEATISALEAQGFVETCGAMGHMWVLELRTAEGHIGPYIRWRRAEHPERLGTLDLVPLFTDELRRRYTHPYKLVKRSTG
jgi:predicted phosphodiesterase